MVTQGTDMIYEVVPTRALHIRRLALKLRPIARTTLGRHGIDARRALHDAVIQSHFCRTALIDGEPQAMWGLKAPILSDAAYVWLAMSDMVTRFPKSIVVEARRQIAEMAAGYRELFTILIPEDKPSVAFAAFLGFDAGDDKRTMSRRAKEAELLEYPHIEAVNGNVIAVRWRA